jgi:hypothetical protein
MPPDLLTATVEPLRGARVLAMVGPKAPQGVRFVRELSACRTFAGLRAELTQLRRLSPREVEEWFEAIRYALSS